MRDFAPAAASVPARSLQCLVGNCVGQDVVVSLVERGSGGAVIGPWRVFLFTADAAAGQQQGRNTGE